VLGVAVGFIVGAVGVADDAGEPGAALPAAAPLFDIALLAGEVGAGVAAVDAGVCAGVVEATGVDGLLFAPDSAPGFELSPLQPNATTSPRLAIVNVTVFDMGHLAVFTLSSHSHTLRLIRVAQKTD
jgi:hypothetical protein